MSTGDDTPGDDTPGDDTPGDPTPGDPTPGDPTPTDPTPVGRLELHRRVIEKVAAQAASEVSAAGGRSGGVLGLGARTDLDARPGATARLDSGSATVRIDIGLRYPTPLRAATEDVRRRVADRVERLTGVPVHRVDVDVRWLTRDEPPRRPR